jgi:SET domain-containing protein
MSVANDTPNLKLVHLCFFAAREILPYEELCFNYSYSNGNADDGDGIKCACGAAGCKGIRF